MCVVCIVRASVCVLLLKNSRILFAMREWKKRNSFDTIYAILVETIYNYTFATTIMSRMMSQMIMIIVDGGTKRSNYGRDLTCV